MSSKPPKETALTAPISTEYDFGAVRDLYRAALIELVGLGVPIDSAIEQIGCPREAVNTELMVELRMIETRLEARLLKTIVTESEEKWQAAAWLLSRRWPSKWQPRGEKDAKVGATALIVDVIKDFS